MTNWNGATDWQDTVPSSAQPPGIGSKVWTDSSSYLYGAMIPAATYGDSKARLATANNNYSVLTPAVLAPGGISTTQLDRAAIAYYYPQLQWYGDGGIANETLVQMIARETATASATRKSLDDLASTGAKVLFFRAGVNDVNALTAASSPESDANVATIIANRKDLLIRASQRFPVVIDEGLVAIDPTTPTANTAYRQAALVYIEKQMAQFIETLDGAVFWCPLSSVVGNGLGGFLPNMGDNTGVDTLGLHLTVAGVQVAYSWLASKLETIFGPCQTSYIKYLGGPNMLQNPDFATTSAQSYGTVADGVTINATGVATRENAEIININNRRFQVCTFRTTSSTSSTCQIKLTAPIVGGSPTYTVAANDILGIEFDILVDDGYGNAPTAEMLDTDASFNCQFLFTATANNYFYWFGSSAYEKKPTTAMRMRVHSPRMTAPVDSATLTAVDIYFRYICAGAGVVRLGIGAPRLIKL